VSHAINTLYNRTPFLCGTVEGRKNVLVVNFSILLYRKVNLVGIIGEFKLKIPTSFQKATGKKLPIMKVDT